MSLFRDLGERVERFKQEAVDASRDRAEYECRACGEPVYTEQEQCPHCGKEAVHRVANGDSESSARADDGDVPDSSERDERRGTADEAENASGSGDESESATDDANRVETDDRQTDSKVDSDSRVDSDSTE